MLSSVTRRDVIRLAAAMLPIVSCGADVTSVPPQDDLPDDAVVISSTGVRVRVNRIPALLAADGVVVLLAARIIVVRTGPAAFRALSAECPHSGCGVSIVDRPRLICPCHGSEFNFAGDRLSGPAPTGLVLLQSEYDEARRELLVVR